jgi:hypothetical protein
MYDAALVPVTGSVDVPPARRESLQWRLFARRAQRNPAMVAFVVPWDGGRCAWFGAGSARADGAFQLHHRDYDHECAYGITVVIATPTAKRPGRSVEVPDCSACEEAACRPTAPTITGR